MRTYLYLSYKCNCNCFFCASDKTNTLSTANEVSIEEAQRFILNSPIKDNLIISGGEPTIHNDFIDIVRYAKQHFKHVSLMTNCIRFSDAGFLKKTIEAGVDRISIPFYSSIEKEYNYMVGNQNAFKSYIQGLSNINALLPERQFEVQIKLLLAKFTYKLNPKSIEYIATRFPNIKQLSLFGFHISNKALSHADECIIDYNESRTYNDKTILSLIQNSFDFHVCEVPLCAFSEGIIGYLIKTKRVVYTDDTYLKRPDRRTNIVSSSHYLPKECTLCSLTKLCPKILNKNASLFNHGIKPIIL